MNDQNRRPNIVMILSDDHGAWALGCAGNSELKTPNLDRLAASGVRFDSFFCVSPVCSPARASIMTGKIPSQHGIHDWLAKGHLDEEDVSPDLRQAFTDKNAPWYISWPKTQMKGDKAIRYLDRQRTYTEELAANGYECGISGKWHMGDSVHPQKGFTYWHTTGLGGENYFYPTVLENGKVVLKEGEYVTDIITDGALRFLDERDREKPFYLSVHYTAPHSPWSEISHPKEYIDLYRDCPFDSTPNVPAHPWTPYANVTKEEWDSKPHKGIRFSGAKYAPVKETWQEHRRESLTGYYAALTAMDAGIGKLLDKLDAEGLTDNTLIIFTGDNGMNMGHHGIWGKGNGTYPLNMYDTSVKVPGIFSFPGRIPAGRVCREPASHYDIYDTILDAAGIKAEADPTRPGVSIMPLLEGKAEHVRDAVVVYDEYGACRMIRNTEWKLVRRLPEGPDELYHLTSDPGEEKNIIDAPEYAEIQAALSAELDDWFARYVDPELDGSREKVTGKGQITSHLFK